MTSRVRGQHRVLVAGFLAGLLGVTLAGVPATARPTDHRAAPRPVGVAQPHWAAVKAAASGRQVRPAGDSAARTAAGRDLMATSSASLTPCEDDPTFLCTTVPVPLDRRHPDGRMVNIHVEVFPHTGPAAEPEGAVFVTCGGPGCSATLGPKYGFSFFVLPEIAETRDLVYVDQRGVGLSDVIDCPQLQAGVLGELYSAARACHDQLGDTANLYGTVDVADDLDDVRKALGYDRIDLFGGSYAGDDMITYAVRHRATCALRCSRPRPWSWASTRSTRTRRRRCRAWSPGCAADPRPVTGHTRTRPATSPGSPSGCATIRSPASGPTRPAPPIG